MTTAVLSDLIIQKVCSVSTMYTEKNAGSRRKNRPQWALVVKYEGETCYTANGREYISNIHNIVLLPKGCDYTWQCREAGRFCIVEFACDAACSDIFLFPVKDGEHYRRVIQRMERERPLKKPGGALDELRDLYGCLSALLKTAGQPYVSLPQRQKIAPAMEYIAAHGGRGICVADLAAMTGLSPVYFRKLFREAMGMSPLRYIQSVRMGKAKTMLESDYAGITSIACSLGYDNVYAFSRDFKKYTGLSPSAYAKQHRQGQ